MQLAHRLVDDQHGAGGAGRVHEPTPLVLVGERAGRVVEVGDDVGEPGRRVPQHLPPAVHVPPGEPLGHGDGHQPGPGLAHQLKDVGVRGRLDGDALAAPGEEMTDGVDRAHRTGRHHDLLGHGRDAARGVPLGEHLAQRGQPRRIVAVRVRVRRQLLQGALDGTGEPRLGRGQRRAAEVDHGAEGLGRQRFQAARGQRVPGRYGGPAARSPAGLQEAFGRAAPRRPRRRSCG